MHPPATLRITWCSAVTPAYRLPLDLMLGADEKDPPETDWLASHQNRLRDAYLRAGEHLRQQADARKAINDKSTKGEFI